MSTNSELGYWIEVSDPFGERLAQIDEYLRLAYTRTANDVGVLTLDLASTPGEALWRLDGRLGIWRQGAGGLLDLETETVWFMRRYQRVLGNNGERRFRITAVSASHLLDRRIVAYAAGSAQAAKTGKADDVMKAIVRENLGSSATDPARDWSSLVTVAADQSLGPTISKAFSRRRVLTVLGEIAADAAEQGTPMYFDVICPERGELEFRTYSGQRGEDRTPISNQLVLSPELGTIADGEYADDYLDEATYIYAAGQGEESERQVEEASDAARIGASPFGRIEQLRDARQVTTTAALEAEAAATLYASRPRRTFRGTLVDTPQVRYGRDWHWGDRVMAQFEGQTFECCINSISVTIENGQETISAALTAEELL